jgi:hypothetical protein
MQEKKGKGRPPLGENTRKQYNGTLEPFKIEVIGGTKECNHLAYEHLTKVYKNKLKGGR